MILENILNIQTTIKKGSSLTNIQINNLKYKKYMITNPNINTINNFKNIEKESIIKSERVLLSGDYPFTNDPFDLTSPNNVNLTLNTNTITKNKLQSIVTSNRSSRIFPLQNDYSILDSIKNTLYLYSGTSIDCGVLDIKYDTFGDIIQKVVCVCDSQLTRLYRNSTDFFIIMMIKPNNFLNSIICVEYDQNFVPLRNRLYFNNNSSNVNGDVYVNQSDQTNNFTNNFKVYCILPRTSFRLNLYCTPGSPNKTGNIGDLIDFSFSSFSTRENVYSLIRNNYYLTSNEIQYGSALNGNLFYGPGVTRIKLKYGLLLPCPEGLQNNLNLTIKSDNSQTNTVIYVCDPSKKYICTNLTKSSVPWYDKDTNGSIFEKSNQDRFSGNYIFLVFRANNGPPLTLSPDFLSFSLNNDTEYILSPSNTAINFISSQQNINSSGYFLNISNDINTITFNNSTNLNDSVTLTFNNLNDLLNYTFQVNSNIQILFIGPITSYILNANINGFNSINLSPNILYFVSAPAGKITGEIISINAFIRVLITRDSFDLNDAVFKSYKSGDITINKEANKAFIITNYNQDLTVLTSSNYLVSGIIPNLINVSSVYVKKIKSPAYLIEYNGVVVNNVYTPTGIDGDFIYFLKSNIGTFNYKIGYFIAEPPQDIFIYFNREFRNVIIQPGNYVNDEGILELVRLFNTILIDANMDYLKFSNKTKITNGNSDYFITFTNENKLFYGFTNEKITILKNTSLISPEQVNLNKINTIKINLLNFSNFGFLRESMTLITLNKGGDKLIIENYISNFKKFLPDNIILSNLILESYDNLNQRYITNEDLNISFSINCYN